MTDFRAARERMIREDLISRGIADRRLLAAFDAIPRELFVPSELRHRAYDDSPLPIAADQTISQPFMVARMIDVARITQRDRVLEVGAGSGYAAAIMSRIAREVVTVDRHPPLVAEARRRLERLGYGNVAVHVGDGTLGWPEQAPFDRILIAAGAPQVPEQLLREQLAHGGLAVLPVGPEDEQMLVVVRRHGQKLTSTDVCPCRFVKLIGNEGWKGE